MNTTYYNVDILVLVVTLGYHSFTISNNVTIGTDKLPFTCDKDNHATSHTYPRTTDPAAGKVLEITKTSNTEFTVDVGTSPVSVHSYPRSVDPYYDTAISIGSTTDTSITVNVTAAKDLDQYAPVSYTHLRAHETDS